MKIKAIYRKNLKMTEGKVAAQVAHAVKNLGKTPKNSDIIVLKVSDKKFEELTKEHDCYVQIDKGLTELDPNTPTAAAWKVNKKKVKTIGLSDCCNFKTIPPDWEMAESMGSMWSAYACHICKKCCKECEINE